MPTIVLTSRTPEGYRVYDVDGVRVQVNTEEAKDADVIAEMDLTQRNPRPTE